LCIDYIYISTHITQSVPLKTGKSARQNKETFLFRLVFGRLNAHSTWEGLLFQQDGAMCHTSRDSVVRVQEVFTEETACKVLWLPRSLDLSTRPFFYYLLVCMKGKVNESNPHTLDETRKNIRDAIETIEVAVSPKVNLNVIIHASNCLIHKDLITKILRNCVHLVHQKLNETKPFMISPSKRAGFKWKILNMFIYDNGIKIDQLDVTCFFI